jgi:hypothetical protein
MKYTGSFEEDFKQLASAHGLTPEEDESHESLRQRFFGLRRKTGKGLNLFTGAKLVHVEKLRSGMIVQTPAVVDIPTVDGQWYIRVGNAEQKFSMRDIDKKFKAVQ